MLTRDVLLACAMLTVTAAAASPAAWQEPPACRASGSMMLLPNLPEASGLAPSRTTPGWLWSHNDSSDPEIFSIDAEGNVTGRVALSGAAVEDWEAIAAGPCADGACLYVADIGDNNASRREIVVYRLPEPQARGGSAQSDAVFRASYPDGAHDAETLLVSAQGRLYIVTKGETGPVALYRFPDELSAEAVMRLERVGVLSAERPDQDARITDGTVSPDGEWVVLRTHRALAFYPAAPFLAGDFRASSRVDLSPIGEPQGEGVAFGPGNTLYVAGEGGASGAGTLAMLSCVP